MTVLVTLAVLAVASCAAAGLASDDCRTAVAVAACAVRYSCGAREAAAGTAAAARALLACLAGGAALLLCAAARATSDFACRATASVIPG